MKSIEVKKSLQENSMEDFYSFLLILQCLEKELIRTYFQKDHIEKAFGYLRGNACMAPIGYQLPNRVEAYLSVVNFISYELIAAILWKIEKSKIGISYDNLIERASKIFEVEFSSKGSKLYRWTHISKEDEKVFKPFNILSVRS